MEGALPPMGDMKSIQQALMEEELIEMGCGVNQARARLLRGLDLLLYLLNFQPSPMQQGR
jgi:hypothetical protein